MKPSTPDPQTAELLAVTQADRDAAADIWRDYVAKVGEVIAERSIREGKMDFGLPSILAKHRLAHAKEQAAGVEPWQPIETAPKDGTRLNLCWGATENLDAHVELGKWSASQGWVNTYGKPFFGDPDYYQRLPEPPLTPWYAAPEALAAPASSVPDSTPDPALLREALEAVLAYREGRGAYAFHTLPAADRENAAFDAWQEVEAKVRAALSQESRK
jgi:hypothetical protein